MSLNLETCCRHAAVAAAFGAVLGPVLAFGQNEAESLSGSFRKAARRVLPTVVMVRPVGIGRATGQPTGVPALRRSSTSDRRAAIPFGSDQWIGCRHRCRQGLCPDK